MARPRSEAATEGRYGNGAILGFEAKRGPAVDKLHVHDARKLGIFVDRVHRELTDADVRKITGVHLNRLSGELRIKDAGRLVGATA